MKEKLLSFICATVLACVMTISTALPAFAETEAETETYGPGFIKTSVSDTESTARGMKGESLGMFSTTGYCSCDKCSGGHNLTYSGTVPKAMHTLSADLTRFPIGTKLMVGDVVYTVEDMGSAVTGNTIDIFYDSHEAALAHGRKNQEVFLASDITMVNEAPISK